MGNAESSTARNAQTRGRKGGGLYASSTARAARPYAPPPPPSSPSSSSPADEDNGTTKHIHKNTCSDRVFADMLSDILIHGNFALSMVRRMALLESMEQVILSSSQQKYTAAAANLHQTLTEIVAECVLTSPTLADVEKDLLVRQGLVQQRWDCVFASQSQYYRHGRAIQRVTHSPFVNYRKMILRLLRTSRKFQANPQLPASSWQRLRAMILHTHDMVELNGLLERVLERTCGHDIKTRILQDVASYRYHRLLLPDRLDCVELEEEEDDVPPGTTGAVNRTNPRIDKNHSRDATADAVPSSRSFFILDSTVYKRILLLEEQKQQEESCPICLDPVRAPAVQLQCDHVFCGQCIGEWIEQQQKEQKQQQQQQRQQQRQQSHRRLTSWQQQQQQGSANPKNNLPISGCPLCRRPFSSAGHDSNTAVSSH